MHMDPSCMPLPPAKLARTDLCGVNCIQQGLRLLAVHLTQGNWRLQVCLVALGQDLLLHVLIAAICPERVVGILCCIQVPAQDSNCKATHTVQCVEPSRLWAVQEQRAHWVVNVQPHCHNQTSRQSALTCTCAALTLGMHVHHGTKV